MKILIEYIALSTGEKNIIHATGLGDLAWKLDSLGIDTVVDDDYLKVLEFTVDIDN